MSINRRVNKEDVGCECVCVCARTHTHTLDYDSALKKNEILPSVPTWLDLEIIILSEVNQIKTNII